MTYCSCCGAKFEGEGYLCPDCMIDINEAAEKKKNTDQNRRNKSFWYGRTNSRKEKKYDE